MKTLHASFFAYCFLILGTLFFFVLFASCKKIVSLQETPVSSEEGALVTGKPNIILILGDDIGYEIPTCNGGQTYSTPNIDLLSKSGMRFTQTQACPKCSPTRVELMTGKYNFRNYTEWGKLDLTQKTLGNMLHNAGYNTCYAGKWQLDGGDSAIRNSGFDKYLVFLPFISAASEEVENLYRYKNPRLYEKGQFLPASQTKGKYADDLFTNYILKFIDSNQTKPFFVLYSTSLCHHPFSPTPDDPEYAAWDPLTSPSDKKFFPSMVKYMDKEIEKIIGRLYSTGLTNNTIIIFTGDNGTPSGIVSLFKGQKIIGGKATSTIYGTHVPLIVRWTGTVPGNQVSNAITDFSDFLPTLAGMANIPVPTNYGTLDGVSFVPALRGSQTNLRNWTFCSWRQQDQVAGLWYWKRWVQDRTYKLYDSTNQNHFFNIVRDPFELDPIPNDSLTSTEVTIKNKFKGVLNTMLK
jgi:arylsulfatase A